MIWWTIAAFFTGVTVGFLLATLIIARKGN